MEEQPQAMMQQDQGLLGFTDVSPPVAQMPSFGDVMGETAPAQPDPMGFPGDPMGLLGAGAEAAPAPLPVAAGSGGTSPAGYVDPFQGMPVKDAGSMGLSSKTIPEMNALREWEDKHERDLEEMTRREEAEKKEKKKLAMDDLQKWHEDRTASIKTRCATNRTDEEQAEILRAEQMKPGANPWERVADLIDTSARSAEDSRDTSRMRALLIQLKTSPVTAAA